jgi:hypothetical protein
MQDPQSKKKFLVESSGKPFSVDISTKRGQMAPQFVANSIMDKCMGQRPPSFESRAQNRMSGYKVYSPVKCQSQNQKHPRTMTMAGSPVKLQNSMKRNGRFSRGPGINNGQQINMPKNNNNNRPNMQERQHYNQNQHQQNLQMLNQNFLNDPKNAMQKGPKKEARQGPRLSEKATGYAPSPTARTSTGPNARTVTCKPPLQTP